MSEVSRRSLITGVIISAAASAAPGKPNFSGKWHLDPRDSKDAPADLIETIDHREPVIRIDTEWDHSSPTGVSNAAMLAPAMQLKTDGAESSNEMPMGMTLVTKSHWEGDKLATEWRVSGLDNPMTGTWNRYSTGP